MKSISSWEVFPDKLTISPGNLCYNMEQKKTESKYKLKGSSIAMCASKIALFLLFTCSKKGIKSL